MASASLARPARVLISTATVLKLPVRPTACVLNHLQIQDLPSNSFNLTFIRNASHQSQGRANGPKDGPGKRLGAKKTGEQYVVPGNIIYRQRGTLWFPGENCAMGRDHTIFATEKGYVKYYKDPAKNPKKRYIGVALERNMTLPTPYNAPRRRRLNMVAVPINSGSTHLSDNYVPRPVPIAGAEGEAGLPEGITLEPSGKRGALRPVFTSRDGTVIKMRSNYMFREDNASIGKAAERAGITVRLWRRNDRWLAWRKRAAKKVRAKERASLVKKSKGSKKKKKSTRQPSKHAA